MLELINGDIKKVKEEMKEQKKLASACKKALVKKYKGKLEKADNTYALSIIECEMVDTFFTVTTTIPVWFGDFLVNYQLVKEFEKRLKGYTVHMHIETYHTGRELHIGYRKGNNSGCLELKELPKIAFEKLKHIPQVKEA